MKLSEYITEIGKLSNLNLDEEYKCDKCNGTFKTGNVLLLEAPSNLSINPHPMMIGSFIKIEHNNKSYHLHCPLCNSVHLFGFNKANTEEQKKTIKKKSNKKKAKK